MSDDATPSWWRCDTHGPGTHAAWGCPECVREMRLELGHLRHALAQSGKLAEDRLQQMTADREQYLRLRRRVDDAPVAIMDVRDALGLCAPTEEAFPALYALRGRRVALVDLGPLAIALETTVRPAGRRNRSMKPKRFRVMAAANTYEKLPSGDAPSFDVLDPPAHYVARYNGKELDVRQLAEALQDIAAAGYRLDAGQRAWVKA